MKKIFLTILCLLFTSVLFAQDPLADKFDYYQKAKPTTNLFVHFDKNVYTSNETVWFSGYLISTKNFNKHRLMSVSLVRENDHKVMLEDRFLMQGGFAFGTIIIPDSIPPGNYRFLAITDYSINSLPEVSFTQPVTIKSMLEPAFKASVKVLSADAKGTRILVSTTTADNRFLDKPTDVSYTYGGKTNTVKTDGTGQAQINLKLEENITDANLYVLLKNGKDSTSLNLPISQPKGAPWIKFYPEGGDLVGGLVNTVGWEVRDRQQKPIAAKAYLFKDGKVVDTIASNTLGLGSFKMFAEENAKYTFKVAGNNLKDTLFTLPNVKNNGIALTITSAVAADTLRIELRATKAQKVNLRIHNFRKNYLFTSLDVKPGLTPLRIPLTQLDKGLATITFTDSEERPIIERIFFAHYDNTEKININTDKNTYGPREKVSLKLKLKDLDEKAVVSIAVVQDLRMEPGKTTDIESYTYLNNELAGLPIHLKGSSYKNKDYLEHLLLIKGWRRYNWQDLTKAKAADTANKYTNLAFTGVVTKSNKPLTSPLIVGAMGTDNIRLVNTDDTGTFNFNSRELYTESGKKMYLFLNKNTNPAFKFTINNELLAMNKKAAKLPAETEEPPLMTLADNSDLFVKSNEKTIRLKEVAISGKAKNGGFGPNPCGDFVCVFNILNCRNHFGDPKNTQPIKGQSYKQSVNATPEVYNGCNVTEDNESIFFRTEGVHLHKEFYVDSFKDPLEPAYFSTIFWNYALVLEKDKEATVDFYTTDILGKFRIVVQGITKSQVIANQKFFEVKRK